MNLCLDIDGTITEHPQFFSLLSHAVKRTGGTVRIVSSRTRSAETMEATRRELNDLRIAFDHLFLLPDQATADAGCPFGDLDWYQRLNFQKTVYCKANKVDIYFDDETKVIELFKRFLPEIQVFQVHQKGAR